MNRQKCDTFSIIICSQFAHEKKTMVDDIYLYIHRCYTQRCSKNWNRERNFIFRRIYYSIIQYLAESRLILYPAFAVKMNKIYSLTKWWLRALWIINNGNNHFVYYLLISYSTIYFHFYLVIDWLCQHILTHNYEHIACAARFH